MQMNTFPFLLWLTVCFTFLHQQEAVLLLLSLVMPLLLLILRWLLYRVHWMSSRPQGLFPRFFLNLSLQHCPAFFDLY